MGFNYAKERAEFEREWALLRKEYELAGMSKQDIESLYAYDLEWFKSRRRYEAHRQEFRLQDLSEATEGQLSLLYRKFDVLSQPFDEEDIPGLNAWIDTIENPVLHQKLRSLCTSDLTLLTEIAILGFSAAEVARKRGCSRNVISRKYRRIKKFLK